MAARGTRLTTMKILLLLVAVSVTTWTQQPQPQANQEHTAWLAANLTKIWTVKPGMTRQDLLKVFTTEGGISDRTHRTYVLHECYLIKVDVEFRPVSCTNDGLWENPLDIIEKISRPYLAGPVMD